MRRAAARLARLESRIPAGCAVCRRWGPSVYAFGDGAPERPERCPACGRVVPIRLIRQLIIVRPEVDR